VTYLLNLANVSTLVYTSVLRLFLEPEIEHSCGKHQDDNDDESDTIMAMEGKAEAADTEAAQVEAAEVEVVEVRAWGCIVWLLILAAHPYRIAKERPV